MRGGQQGAGEQHAQIYARSEVSTRFMVTSGVRSTNNKSKGSKAQLQGGWQGRAAGWFAMRSWHRSPVFPNEMVTVPRVFWYKMHTRQAFRPEIAGFVALFSHENAGTWSAALERARFEFICENRASASLFWLKYTGFGIGACKLCRLRV